MCDDYLGLHPLLPRHPSPLHLLGDLSEHNDKSLEQHNDQS